MYNYIYNYTSIRKPGLQSIFSHIDKDEISNKDIFQFYFKLNEFLIKDKGELDSLFFDYKIDDDLNKFINICDTLGGMELRQMVCCETKKYYLLIKYKSIQLNKLDIFNKAVEEFLDEN